MSRTLLLMLILSLSTTESAAFSAQKPKRDAANNNNNNKRKRNNDDKLARKSWDSKKENRRRKHLFAIEFVGSPLKPIPGASQLCLQKYCQPLPIMYTNDPHVVKQWVKTHLEENNSQGDGCKVVGFDTEAVPQFQKTANPVLQQVSVVQLATPTHALVVQLAKASGRPSRICHDILKSRVLESPQLIKAGCGLDDDLIHIARSWRRPPASITAAAPFLAPNRFDLGGIPTVSSSMPRVTEKNKKVPDKRDAETAPTSTGPSGLKAVTGLVLGLDLPKSRRLATSNWGRVPLSTAQVLYSARDAWAAAAVMDRLANLDANSFGPNELQRRLMTSQPPLHRLVRIQKKRRRAKQRLKWVREARRAGQLSVGVAQERMDKLYRVLQKYPPLRPEPISLDTAMIRIPTVTMPSVAMALNQTVVGCGWNNATNTT